MFTEEFMKRYNELRKILLNEAKQGKDPKKTKPEEHEEWEHMELLIKTEYF